MIQLFRFKNLIFIVITQWLIYTAIISPIFDKYGLTTLLPAAAFWLMVLATVLIAAGGYVINDYFDLKIDRINRPESVVIGERLSKKLAMRLYMALTGVGVLIGIVLAVWLKNISLGFIFVIVPGMLWFYSSTYKRQFLIGNVIVSLCCALAVLVLLVAESGVQTAYYGDLIRQTPVLQQLFRWVCGYAVFAFFITLIREIVKDMEDLEGDRQMECRTLPIVWGERNAKITVTVLAAVCLLAVFVFDWLYFDTPKGNMFFTLFSPANVFIVFVALFLWFIWYSKGKKYSAASLVLKLLMSAGILYSLVFYYLMAQAYQLTMFGLFKVV